MGHEQQVYKAIRSECYDLIGAYRDIESEYPNESNMATMIDKAHASVWDGRGQAYRLNKQDPLGHLLFMVGQWERMENEA